MTTFPRWKLVVVSVALLLGLLFSIPNLFRNDPAVQLARRGYEPINAADRESGATPLFHAASWGRVAAVDALLEGKADPNLANASGVTPLAIARQNGHPEVVDLLEKAGAR